MAFAQLTYRESLRDIETCLSVQPSKLYGMGFREPVRRSTLADANEGRDWRIHAELAQRLIVRARKLYVGEDLGLDLANTVYALDATTIDLCLAVFPWAHFRGTKAAVKMHTLLDLRGNIPSFIHVSDGKLPSIEIFERAVRLFDEAVNFAGGRDDAFGRELLQCLQAPPAGGHGKLQPCIILGRVDDAGRRSTPHGSVARHGNRHAHTLIA